ncbi:hypothetical protein GO755_29695 [Spirosoma sp. HMF4905]|uniref:Uncharacterized protein n=1 Tax=Spirosoma arboris TaxID=2682092 RepID=A0A7K1SKA2_9BACT|nr:hypothetical protein [Spirosoma arboris]MVM34241.1 hypothetical protein [Spirosoma arboris]
MIQEEILFRLLQGSTATGFVALLITCMSMHEVKWWLPIPIYLLSFMCLVTFLTTFFMRRFTFEVAVITMFVLAVSAVTTALHGYIRPLPTSKREALNRRLLWFILPILGLLFTVWCVGSVYEGGISFFVRFEQKLNHAIQNQDEMKAQLDEQAAEISDLKQSSTKRDATSAAYRQKLDQQFENVNSRLTDQSLRIHRLSTNQQKQGN